MTSSRLSQRAARLCGEHIAAVEITGSSRRSTRELAGRGSLSHSRRTYEIGPTVKGSK